MHHESVRRCPVVERRNRITIHLHPSYVRQLSDLPFFECPRDFILLIAWLRCATYVTEYLTSGTSVMLALCATLYPHTIHPRPDPFLLLA
jgi:hypothetical protein